MRGSSKVLRCEGLLFYCFRSSVPWLNWWGCSDDYDDGMVLVVKVVQW